MPKRSDDSCEKSLGPVRVVEPVTGQLIRIKEQIFYRFKGPNGIINVPGELIDDLRDDEWVYDSAQHNERKKKVKS